MREVTRKKAWKYQLKLRCRKCGKRATFILGHGPYYTFKRAQSSVPIAGWNGWNLRDTELCPVCNNLSRKLK